MKRVVEILIPRNYSMWPPAADYLVREKIPYRPLFSTLRGEGLHMNELLGDILKILYPPPLPSHVKFPK